MNFTNNQIHSDALPQIDDVLLKPISKQYIKIITLNKLVVYSVMFFVLYLAKLFIHKSIIQNNFWFLFITFLIFCVFNFIISLLAFNKRKYAIREKDIIYVKGLVVNSVITVPISRIQHIEESRSWLARQFNISTLKIYTAGESGSDLSIKGLPHIEAKQINDFLSAKVNGTN